MHNLLKVVYKEPTNNITQWWNTECFLSMIGKQGNLLSPLLSTALEIPTRWIRILRCKQRKLSCYRGDYGKNPIASAKRASRPSKWRQLGYNIKDLQSTSIIFIEESLRRRNKPSRAAPHAVGKLRPTRPAGGGKVAARGRASPRRGLTVSLLLRMGSSVKVSHQRSVKPTTGVLIASTALREKGFSATQSASRRSQKSFLFHNLQVSHAFPAGLCWWRQWSARSRLP